MTENEGIIGLSGDDIDGNGVDGAVAVRYHRLR